ncbi:pentatricopeptide repeat-containing protein At4g02820, mitochondrial [Nymphaea colorata]|nr:pentatricopeptide repeat-containing protein At4g02820, mitochondrial [Nymphaea colorata]
MATPAGLYARLAGFRRTLVGDAVRFLDRQVLHLSTESSPSSTSSAKKQRDTLGRRMLSLVYPKRSAVIALRQWIEEGRTARKYELNRIVRELRKHKRFKHALEICEWMTLQQDIKLLPGDYAVHLDLIAKVRGLTSAHKFFEDLPQKMKEKSTYTSLLHVYVQSKLSTKAEALMEKMLELGIAKNPLPYNHILNMYIANGKLDKVPLVMQQLKKNTVPDLFTYNLMLSACAISKDVKGAEKVLLELNERMGNGDWVTYSTLSNIYINAGLVEKTRNALKEMELRISCQERSAYCSLMTLYASVSSKDDVCRIWRNMKLTFRKMSDFEYSCMLSSLTKLDDIEGAESICAEWESVSPTNDARIPNILLGAYVRKSMLEKAESFHEHMLQHGIKPSYTTWELLALASLKKMDTDKALDALQKAISSVTKWTPNEEIIQLVFENVETLGDIEGVEKFLVILRGSGYVTTAVYNSLLRTYAKAGKMPLLIIERMKKDNVKIEEETKKLLKMTSKLPVGKVSSTIL